MKPNFKIYRYSDSCCHLELSLLNPSLELSQPAFTCKNNSWTVYYLCQPGAKGICDLTNGSVFLGIKVLSYSLVRILNLEFQHLEKNSLSCLQSQSLNFKYLKKVKQPRWKQVSETYCKISTSQLIGIVFAPQSASPSSSLG